MMGEFSVIDWIVLVFLLISVLHAFTKGFIRELVGLSSVLLAFLFAAWFYTSAAALFKDVVKTENLALFFGFSIVFVGTLVAGAMVAWLVSTFVKAAKLQWFDRCLGALFGLVRGWLLGGIVYFGLTAFNVQSGSVRNSALAPYFLPASRIIAMVTPSEFKNRFQMGYEAIERWWKLQH